MTIKVRVENQDQSRTIEIVAREFDKVTQKVTERWMHDLAPGAASTVYVHLLSDLVVKEKHP